VKKRNAYKRQNKVKRFVEAPSNSPTHVFARAIEESNKKFLLSTEEFRCGEIQIVEVREGRDRLKVEFLLGAEVLAG